MNHQLFHSPFKPVNSGSQPPSSLHREGHEAFSRVVTMGPPPQRAATSLHHHQSQISLCTLCRLQGTASKIFQRCTRKYSTPPPLPLRSPLLRQTFTSTFPLLLPFLPFARRLYHTPSRQAKEKELHGAWKMALGASSSF